MGSSNFMRYAVLAFVTTVIMSTTVSCGDACLDLSKKICQCEPTESEQRMCITQLNRQADFREPSAAQQERCSEILTTTCKPEDMCAKLERGEFAACGLSDAQ